jgi:hypothetical protein
MSFNLMAEGVLDYEEIATHVASFEPLELFPVPATHAGEVSALGIACPSSRCGDEAARALERIVRFMWARNARVYELFDGRIIDGEAVLEDVKQMIR